MHMQWTEKQMEAWLEPIARIVVDDVGNSMRLEQTTLFWEYFDYLTAKRMFSEAELIQLGRDTEEESRLPFPLAIQDAVCHLYKSWYDGD